MLRGAVTGTRVRRQSRQSVCRDSGDTLAGSAGVVGGAGQLQKQVTRVGVRRTSCHAAITPCCPSPPSPPPHTPRQTRTRVRGGGGVGWSVYVVAVEDGGGKKHTFKNLNKRALMRKWSIAYLLGLLAMIKCSICSYQCDN